jgi:hypothetical protein
VEIIDLLKEVDEVILENKQASKRLITHLFDADAHGPKADKK